jgi:Zn-dependent protease with chaperone function
MGVLMKKNINEGFLSKLLNASDFIYMLYFEAVMWCISWLLMKMLFSNVKIDKNLTTKLSKITGEQWVANYLKLDIPNAFCDDNRNVYITSAMIKKLKLTENEQISILLHEIGHGHQKLVFALTDIGHKASLYFTFRLVDELWNNSKAMRFIFSNPYLSIMTVTFIYRLMAAFGYYPISRSYEWNADDYAIKHGYGKPFASAFRKLIKWIDKENKKQGIGKQVDPDKATRFQKVMLRLEELLSTHPNTFKRIKNAIEKSEKNQSNKSSFSTHVKSVIDGLGLKYVSKYVTDIVSKVKGMMNL